MSLTTVGTGNKVIQWIKKFFSEYTREDWFKPYMGTKPTDIIQVKEELTNKKGYKISIPLITRLLGGGVSGNATLEGNEEELGNYNHDVEVFTKRNGVVTTVNEQQKSEVDILNAAKPQLKNWQLDLDRDAMITALMSMGENKAYLASQATAESNYEDVATEGEKDTYLTNNSDRMLFGSAISNQVAGDHSASLANIDNTDDKMGAGSAGVAKRMAQKADPKIRPYRTKQGEEWFVCFVNTWAMRDLRNDTTVASANREAWARQERMEAGGQKNPIFQGGDILYDGVIFREIPEMPVIAGVGAGGIDVAANYLCGAQTAVKAWASRPDFKTQDTDYEEKKGVAIRSMRGITKVIYDNDKAGKDGLQHGCVTFYTAGVGDA